MMPPEASCRQRAAGAVLAHLAFAGVAFAGVAFALIVVAGVFTGVARAAELRPWTGGPPPALSLPALDGGRVDLEALKGKVVVINFWATWCAPCIKEMPSLAKLAATLPADRFIVVAVNYGESEERIRAFLRKMPIDFPIALDRDMRAARAWNVRVLPVSFVVDRDGRIRFSVLGDLDWSAPEVVEPLRRLTSSSPATGLRAALQ